MTAPALHRDKLTSPRLRKPRKSKAVTRGSFTCAWGTCDLSKHPDIPQRWAARVSQSQTVIPLLEKSQSTRTADAHAAFEAFLVRVAALAIDDTQTARMNAVLRMAVYVPVTVIEATPRHEQAARLLRSNRLPIRRYAA